MVKVKYEIVEFLKYNPSHICFRKVAETKIIILKTIFCYYVKKDDINNEKHFLKYIKYTLKLKGENTFRNFAVLIKQKLIKEFKNKYKKADKIHH